MTQMNQIHPGQRGDENEADPDREPVAAAESRDR
jgi:hypothetical protein